MITVTPAGDAALLLQSDLPDPSGNQNGNAPARLAAAIRAAAIRGVIDVVPGAETVLVSYDPGNRARAELASLLARLPAVPGPPAHRAGHADIDVVYDGPDLADVARLTGLSVGEVIARHQAPDYQVGWLGFSPGFGYLKGLDPVLATVPRLDSPRVFVPAGSVAIAGGLAAVYPAGSPGGWRLLGRTDATLWDPDRDRPALLAPGMRVRFRAVESLAAPRASAQPEGGSAIGPRLIQVLQPGPRTTIQDLGRPGFGHLGVPRSGAADAASLRLANQLAGNDDWTAGLEVTLGRLALRFDCDAIAALAGAPAPIRLTSAGGSVIEPQPVTGFEVSAGSVLRLGAPAVGLRSYLAIGGGIEVAPVLGSRSADSRSGLGHAALRPGEWLPVGRPRFQPEKLRQERPRTSGSRLPELTGETQLRAIAGPRDDWFTAQALATLAGSAYMVSAASDRTGLRLTGPPLRRGRTDELPSEGLALGSLQVTHDGQPILLLADHPTTGGYPVIAVVVAADIGLAGQLRPGQRVRFRVSRAAGWAASSRPE